MSFSIAARSVALNNGLEPGWLCHMPMYCTASRVRCFFSALASAVPLTPHTKPASEASLSGGGTAYFTHPDHTDGIIALPEEQSPRLYVCPYLPAGLFHPCQHIIPRCFRDAVFIAGMGVTHDAIRLPIEAPMAFLLI